MKGPCTLILLKRYGLTVYLTNLLMKADGQAASKHHTNRCLPLPSLTFLRKKAGMARD